VESVTPNHTEPANPDEYNGWKNRETWAAALNLSNDYDLYQIAQRVVAEADRDVQEFYADLDIEQPAIADTNAAADAIETWVNDMVEEYHESRQHAKLIGCLIRDVGSFWRVDWHAVADSFREEQA